MQWPKSLKLQLARELTVVNRSWSNLHPDVIKELKKAALDEDRTAYEITEEAVSAWLATRKASRKGNGL